MKTKAKWNKINKLNRPIFNAFWIDFLGSEKNLLRLFPGKILIPEKINSACLLEILINEVKN
jgi:hypothetical protein